MVGHGLVSNVKSGDLWVWPGIGKYKGKDFAATGSIFGDGEAYFWDVSDPKNLKKYQKSFALIRPFRGTLRAPLWNHLWSPCVA